MNRFPCPAEPVEIHSGDPGAPGHAKSALLVALLVLLSGCQTWSIADSLPWSDKNRFKESTAPEPDRIVAVWTDTTYFQPGSPSMRGFGGRLYFYDIQGESLPVDGQLVVYAYDDSDPSKTNHHSKTPDRKYVFTAEQFKRFQSDSPLGVSYSIWIPWDQQGGPPKSVSLMPTLTSSTGKIIQGAPSVNVLPGPAAEAPNVEPAGFTGPFGGNGQPPLARSLQPTPGQQNLPTGNYQPGDGSIPPMHAQPTQAQMRTVTLNVPPTMQQRIMNAQGNAAGASSEGTIIQQSSVGGAPSTPLQKKAAAYFASVEQQKQAEAARVANNYQPPPLQPAYNGNGVNDQTMTGQNVNGQFANGQAAGATGQAAATAQAGATAPPPSQPPPTHYGWPKRRARGESIARPDRDRDPWRQSR